MDKNANVLIEAVENGFIICPEPNYRDNGTTSLKSRYVFQSFAELSVWLSKHFEYRISVIRGD